MMFNCCGQFIHPASLDLIALFEAAVLTAAFFYLHGVLLTDRTVNPIRCPPLPPGSQ